MAERTSGAAAGAPPLAVGEHEQARVVAEQIIENSEKGGYAALFVPMEHDGPGRWFQPGHPNLPESDFPEDALTLARDYLALLDDQQTSDGPSRRPPTTPVEIQDRPVPKPERKDG